MSFEYHTEGTCARNIILEMDGDIIKAAEQESWIQRQVTFDFL